MSKILALWSVPRSRSTAFTLMMGLRGDFTAYSEPFEGAAYGSNEKIFDRDDARDTNLNYADTLAMLLNTNKTQQLFIKDHAYHFPHIVNKEFLDYFQHSFLIRDPAKALPSYFARWPDVSIKETGYKALSELFDKVTEHTGNIPLLFDGDDLVKNPERTVKNYCKHVGIPYIADALQWKPNRENTWPWHEHLATTRGFEENPKRQYLEIHDNDRLKWLYDECMPYYEKLYRQRMRIDEDAVPAS